MVICGSYSCFAFWVFIVWLMVGYSWYLVAFYGRVGVFFVEAYYQDVIIKKGEF